MYSEEINERLGKIENEFRCRTKQIRKFVHYLNLFGTENIIISGPRATGKTSIVKMLLNEFNLSYLWFDMINLDQTNSFFYEKFLNELSKFMEKFDDYLFEKNIPKHFNHVQFLDYFTYLLNNYQKILKNKNSNVPMENKLFIVLDNFDILIDENNENLIYLFNNINYLTNNICPISVIWIGKYHLERIFRLTEFKMSSLQINFDAYTQEELYILLSDPKITPNDPHNLYKNFVNLILKTLVPFEDNYLNLKFICQNYFDYYTEPMNESEFSYLKMGQLYVRFQSKLQEIINYIGGDVVNGLKFNINNYISSLSPLMCYIFVSIYIATYNSTKTDVRFFVRNQKSRSKSERFRKSLHMLKENEKCPKWFELERAYHIFRALVDLNEKDRETRQSLLINDYLFFRKMANLFELKILTPKTMHGWSCSPESKYQLSQAITDDMIIDIASQIDLNINSFLTHRIERIIDDNSGKKKL